MPEGDREWGSTQCSSLERLEDFVRQFVGQAPTHMFVQTLLVLEAADQKAAKHASSTGKLQYRILSICCMGTVIVLLPGYAILFLGFEVLWMCGVWHAISFGR